MTSASASAQTERRPPEETRRAYEACAAIAAAHYENFPVASLLLPRSTRPFLRSIYAFARTADDFADEGSLPTEERLRLLDTWERKLHRAAGGDADEAVFIALADTLERTALPVQLLADLLQAFRLDVTRKRHETYADLLGYCRYSANPVGRMMLHLFDRATPELLALSDSLCTALQLTNFWQDVAVDWSRGRLYIPLEDCVRFGYHEADLSSGRADETFRALLRHQVRRTLVLYDEARPLPGAVEGRLRLELALTWRGGREILRAIERRDYDVLSRRPVLTAGTKVRLLVQTLMRGLP